MVHFIRRRIIITEGILRHHSIHDSSLGSSSSSLEASRRFNNGFV